MSKHTFDNLQEVIHDEVREEYKSFGSSLSKKTYYIRIRNSMDYPVFISFDGINDHLCLDAYETFKETVILPAGTKVYYKRGPYGEPSMGSLYLTIIYGE